MHLKLTGPDTSIRFLTKLIRPYYALIGMSLVSALTLITVNILKAFLVSELVGNALSGNITAISRVVFYLVPAIIVAFVATGVSSYATKRASALAIRDLKKLLMQHISRARVSETEKLKSGEIITRFNADAAAVGSFLSEQFPNLLFQPLMFLCSSVYLLSINWKLFVGCYALLPFTFYCANTLNKRGAAYSKSYYEGLDQATTLVKQCLDGVVTVKAYNLGFHMVEKCHSSFKNVLKSVLRREMCDSISLPFYFLTYESPGILCVVIGGLLTWRGEMTIGQLVASTQLVSYVSAPAFALMRLLNSTRRVGISTGRLSEILNLKAEKDCGQPVDSSVVGENCIDFQDVTFGYDAASPVLKEASFSVTSQGITALVGASGEGKTTITALVCGFYEPQQGRIKVFGQDTQQLHPASLRAKVAYVPQDTQLFPGTIADNILMGRREACQEEVYLAATQSQVTEFAQSLPDGLQTVLGERGVGLSGGQRQRVAIARATLRRAPLMVLDEPTAALDATSEMLINISLKEISKNSAVLVASHRLSTVRSADCIIVLEGGRVVEQGTFAELKHKRGAFAAIFAAQLALEQGGEVAI